MRRYVLSIYRLLRFGLVHQVAAARLRNKGIRVGHGLKFWGPAQINSSSTAAFTIGNDVTIGRNVRITVYDGGSLTIEDGVVINDNCCVECTGRMVVGRNTVLVNGVIVY